MEEYYRIATHAISRQPLDALSQRSFHALPRDAAPQLPALHRRTTYVVSRNVDADDRAVVAGLQTDRFGGVAGNLGFASPPTLLFLPWLGGYIGDPYNRPLGVVTTTRGSIAPAVGVGG